MKTDTFAFQFSKSTSTLWSKDLGFNAQFLTATQLWARDILRVRGHLFLNEVLDMLRLDRVREGQTSGWVWKPYHFNTLVNFGMEKADNYKVFQAGKDPNITLSFNCLSDITDLVWGNKE